MRKAPQGYCEKLWDKKREIGPQHILYPTASDGWEGFGKEMPKDFQFLIRERIPEDATGEWYWRIRIDYMECRNCDYGAVMTVAKNDGLLHSPIINHVTVINLEA